MKAKLLCKFVILVALAALMSGCVTAKVWEPRQFARFHEPANPSRVQLFYSTHTHNVLVEYDEIIDTSGKIQRKAYWLEGSQEKEGPDKHPPFVSTRRDRGLQPIEILSKESDSPPTNGLWIVTTNGVNFTLYGTRETNAASSSALSVPLGEYELPAYYDDVGRLKQILRTPPAVLADSLIAAGYLAVFYAPYWWPGLEGH